VWLLALPALTPSLDPWLPIFKRLFLVFWFRFKRKEGRRDSERVRDGPGGRFAVVEVESRNIEGRFGVLNSLCLVSLGIFGFVIVISTTYGWQMAIFGCI
jgi:hypothetical protein